MPSLNSGIAQIAALRTQFAAVPRPEFTFAQANGAPSVTGKSVARPVFGTRSLGLCWVCAGGAPQGGPATCRFLLDDVPWTVLQIPDGSLELVTAVADVEWPVASDGSRIGIEWIEVGSGVAAIGLSAGVVFN